MNANILPNILDVRIAHSRPGAKRNAFAYGAAYLVLPFAFLNAVSANAISTPGLFSLERFNLFGFYARDHGDGRANPENWARDILARWNVAEADGEIVLVTLPRVLGYIFNPVSFWFCLDRAGAVRAVIAEVNNTFGERHSYLCCHDDHAPIAPGDWITTEKIFHVSPFLVAEGHYRFRFVFEPERIAIWINHYGAEGLRLATSMVGKRAPLTAARLALSFVRHPFVTLKVIGLIHWQAVKLFVKGVAPQHKPAPPEMEVSR